MVCGLAPCGDKRGPPARVCGASWCPLRPGARKCANQLEGGLVVKTVGENTLAGSPKALARDNARTSESGPARRLVAPDTVRRTGPRPRQAELASGQARDRSANGSPSSTAVLASRRAKSWPEVPVAPSGRRSNSNPLDGMLDQLDVSGLRSLRRRGPPLGTVKPRAVDGIEFALYAPE